jgi:phage antirepressor YoqD-like protein
MVNATQMAKPFNKRTNDWLRTDQANELITSLSAVTQIPATGLVSVNQGGSYQGTWMHEDVALLFAQWLSPSFYLWCNNRIKELLTTGVSTISSDDEAIIHAMTILQKRVEENKKLAEENKKRAELAKQQVVTLTAHNVAQREQLEEQAPKVLFSDAVEASESSCLIGELAKILEQNGIDIGQNRLFKWLRENNYLGSYGEYYNKPKQKAMEMGLFELEKTTIPQSDGYVVVNTTPKVTAKGQIYFIDKFLSKKFAK